MWGWEKTVQEIGYCVRWFISLTPGMVGRYLRCHCWGIGFVGENVTIDEACWISHPEGLSIGDNVGINKGARFNAVGKIKIGENGLIGPNVVIWTQNHEFSRRDIPIVRQGHQYQEVIIGDDVWIAAGVTVLPGVEIGKGAVICAGAVVTKDVGEFSVVAGVPAKKIRDRSFSDDGQTSK